MVLWEMVVGGVGGRIFGFTDLLAQSIWWWGQTTGN
jgi:hypothetical protein